MCVYMKREKTKDKEKECTQLEMSLRNVDIYVVASFIQVKLTHSNTTVL